MRLGEANVDAMLRGLTATQFRDWELYSLLEPFQEERADLRAAQVVQAIWNSNRAKGVKPAPLSDFTLKFSETEGSKPKQTWQDQKRIFQALAASFRKQPPPAGRT